jgi:PKD repeat protein
LPFSGFSDHRSTEIYMSQQSPPPLPLVLDTSTSHRISIAGTYNCSDTLNDTLIMKIGFSCMMDSLLLRRTSTDSISLSTLTDSSCQVTTISMPYSPITPQLTVLVPDTSTFANDTTCGEFILGFTVRNDNAWYLGHNRIYITVPSGSGYSIPSSGMIDSVTYNGITRSCALRSLGSGVYLLDLSDSTFLPMYSGTLHGLPGTSVGAGPNSMRVRFRFISGCELSYANGINFNFVADKGCNPLDSISFPYSCNPIVLNPHSVYNRIGTTISMPNPFNVRCSLVNTATLHFSNVLFSPLGARKTGAYNKLYLKIPACYTIDSAYTDTAIHFTSSGGYLTYSLPAGVWVDSIPDIHLAMHGSNTCTCDEILSAGIYADRSLVCHGDSCNIHSVEQGPDSAHIILKAPTPIIGLMPGYYSMTAWDTVACSHHWIVDGIAAGRDSSVRITRPGLDTVSVYDTLPNGSGCSSDTVKKYFWIIPQPPGILTNSFTACQILRPSEKVPEAFATDSVSGCIKVCDSSLVRYRVLPHDSIGTYTWQVFGADSVYRYPDGDSINVRWVGVDSIGIVRIAEHIHDSIVGTTQICVQVIARPHAYIGLMPDSSIHLRDTTCLYSTILFADRCTGSDLVSWEWYWGDGSMDIFGHHENPSHTFSRSGLDTVKLKVFNLCGCYDSTFMYVYVDPLRGPHIYCPSALCKGDTAVYFTDDSCSSYGWHVLGGHILSHSPYTRTISVLWDSAVGGMGYISLDGTVCTGLCTHVTFLSIPIIKDSLPIYALNGSCVGGNVLLYQEPIPGMTYSWSVVSGPGTVASVTDQNTFAVKLTGDSSVVVKVSYHYAFETKCPGNSYITIRAADSLKLSGSTSVCSSGSSLYTATGFSSHTHWVLTHDSIIVRNDSGVGSWNIHFSSGPGIYILEAKDSFRCNEPRLIIKVAGTPARPLFISGTDSVCLGRPSLFTADSVTSSTGTPGWIVVGGTPSSSMGNSVTVSWGTSSTRKVGLYALGRTSPYCTSDTIWKNIYPLNPSLHITGPDTVCANSYSRDTMHYSGADDYVWSIIPETAGSVRAGQGTTLTNILWNNTLTTITATIKVEVHYCDTIKVDSFHVTITPTPPATDTFPTPICEGSLITINGVQGNAYQWNLPGARLIIPGSDSSRTPTIYYPIAGIYTVGYLVTDPKGCSGRKNRVDTITVIPSPAHVLGSSSRDVCGGATVTLTATSTPHCTYEFFLNGVSMGAASGTPTYSTSMAGNYSCVITDSTTHCSVASNIINLFCRTGSGTGDSGCTHPATITSTSSCSTATFGILDTAASYHVAGVSWASDDGDTTYYGAGTTWTHDYHAAGIYRIIATVTYTDGCNGTIEDNVTIPIHAEYIAGISCDATGLTHVLTLNSHSSVVPPTVIGSYSWSVIESPSGHATTGIGTNLSLPLLSTTTSVFVNLNITDSATGLPCSSDGIIDVAGFPVAAFSDTDNVCIGYPVHFVDHSTGVGLSWFWDFGDGSTISGLQNPQRVYGGPPISNPSLIITDLYGCSNSSSLPITIRTNALPGGGYLVASPSGCTGSTIRINYDLGTGSTPSFYSWSIGGALNFIDVTSTGSYVLTVSDLFHCKNVVLPASSIIFQSVPTATITGNHDFCIGDPINLDAYAGPGITYRWDQMHHGGVTLGISGAPSISPSISVGDTFYYRVTDTQSGCWNTSPWFEVIVHGSPAAPYITGAYTGCRPFSMRLSTSTTSGFVNWSNGTSGASTTIYDGGSYTAYYTDRYGCSSHKDTVIPSPPNFESFPVGCYIICDTLLPFTIPWVSPATYDYWAFLKNGVVMTSGTGTPSMSFRNAASYRLVLTKLGCTDTSGTMDVEIKNCSGCSCGLKATPHMTARAKLGDSCSYVLFSSFQPNSCTNVVRTIWSYGDGIIDTLLNVDSVVHAYPYNGSFKAKVLIVMINKYTQDTCTATDTVTVIDKGCRTACFCYVKPAVTWKDSACVVTFTFTGYVGACTKLDKLTWSFGDSTAKKDTTGLVIRHTYAYKGVHHVCVYDSSHNIFIPSSRCKDTLCFDINVCPDRPRWADIAFPDDEDAHIPKELSIYPVPADQEVHIRISGTDAEAWRYIVTDNQGRIVASGEKIAGQKEVLQPIGILSDGLYLVRIWDSEGRLYNGKFIKLE